MRYLITALLALFLGVSFAYSTAGNAAAAEQSATLPALKRLAASSPITKVGYRHYCVRQYFRCRHFTDGGWEFKRCMQWKGCWEAYLDYKANHSENSCRDWRHACAENWGRGTDDYYGCLRYHGCD